MKEWWDKLQERERILVATAGIVGIIFIIYMVIWTPIQRAHSTSVSSLEEKKALLTWITQSGARLRQMGPLANGSHIDNRSVLATVDSTSKQLGIRDTIKRIEPNGDDQVTVWAEDIPFDSLMMLLGRLDKQADISTQSADIKQSQSAGKATAKLVLKR